MVNDSGKKIPILLCLICDEPIKFPNYVTDSKKYRGHVRCQNCSSILYIKRIGFDIEEYKIIKDRDRTKEIKAKKRLQKLQDLLDKPDKSS
jgi:acetyl-CoA carboxylase beta subunit